jgi:hypothetical protein
MEITFLLGNGFDIGFGLKTSYNDFYNYLFQKIETDEEIKENLIFNDINSTYQNNKIELWSDYELGIGKYTKNLGEDDKEKFIQDKLQMDRFLKNYLIQENEKLNKTISLSSNILINSFSKMSECRNDDLTLLKKIMSLFSHTLINVNSISFNYTNTVSLVFKEGRLSNRDKIFGYPNNGSLIQINPPFYLHGTLFNEEMIIGVNDESQIENELYAKDNEIKHLLVKNSLLVQAGRGNEREFNSIIDKSNIICIYGLSMGTSDKSYWKKIKERLLGQDIYLIIYAYNQNMVADNIFLKTRERQKVKEQFYKYSETTDKEIQEMENKIIIELNHTIFEPEKKLEE